jgi:hypothetical protein
MSSELSTPMKLTPVELDHGRPGRASEVVDVGTLDREVDGQLADHALLLGVEGHRAQQHVVEDGGDVLAELEIRDARERLGEDLVFLFLAHG